MLRILSKIKQKKFFGLVALIVMVLEQYKQVKAAIIVMDMVLLDASLVVAMEV
jgi:hypothetical protein